MIRFLAFILIFMACFEQQKLFAMEINQAEEENKKGTISHVLLDSTDYDRNDFNIIEKNKALYTSPYKSNKAHTQCTMVYEGTPQENPYEKLLLRLNPGQDGRVRISNTTEWPNVLHAQLSLHFSNNEYGGSGILVGPHHILTAGHNVYDYKTQTWAKKIVARFALNDEAAPFGQQKAARIYTFKEWTESGNKNFDIALVTLGYSIGSDIGWSGMLVDEDNVLKNEKVHVTGYPGDKGFNQLWTMSHQVKKLESDRIFYDMDTYGGQSGGSVLVKREEKPYAIGVHTLGEGNINEGNSGVRLSHEKFKVIQNWISETFHIKHLDSTLPSSSKKTKGHLEDYTDESTFAVTSTFKGFFKSDKKTK